MSEKESRNTSGPLVSAKSIVLAAVGWLLAGVVAAKLLGLFRGEPQAWVYVPFALGALLTLVLLVRRRPGE